MHRILPCASSFLIYKSLGASGRGEKFIRKFLWIKKNCYLCCAQIEAYKCDLQKNSFVKY